MLQICVISINDFNGLSSDNTIRKAYDICLSIIDSITESKCCKNHHMFLGYCILYRAIMLDFYLEQASRFANSNNFDHEIYAVILFEYLHDTYGQNQVVDAENHKKER
tara:strand:- start:37 stop:360 length:324 start_codon:yes stop_codon:yes gene_type:complete